MTQPPPAVGDPAPDFTLTTTAGKPVTLSSFRGAKNVLVAFFPMAFTSTCTAELCAFTDDFAAFSSKDVEVIPISADMVPSLRAYKAQHNMAVELASDLRRDVARAYGVFNEEKFYANRAYFLVDKQGIVRWLHREAVNGQRRENAEILAEIAKLAA
jgi:peroxiredoxin (alkyl hydroperoxide reductase subunit C)